MFVLKHAGGETYLRSGWFRVACLLCWEVAEFVFLHNSSFLDLLTFKAVLFPISSAVLYEEISFQILFPIKFHIPLWFKINVCLYCVILFFQVFEILSRWPSYDAYDAWRSAIYCSSLTDEKYKVSEIEYWFVLSSLLFTWQFLFAFFSNSVFVLSKMRIKL